MLTDRDVVSARQTNNDADYHLADLQRGDVVGLAKSNPHASQSVVKVHEG